MNKHMKALLGGTALAGAGLMTIPAMAQTAQLPGGVVAVQQSAARADAASFNQSPTSTNCNATQASIANMTITVTPPAGNYVYLAGIQAEEGTNATGGSTAETLTSSNLTGSPAWLLDTNTGSTVSAAIVINQLFPTGLKATAAGTAVTITPTTTLPSTYACIQVSGWYSPL